MLSQEEREKRERQRMRAVEEAVKAAEVKIRLLTDGSVETLMWITAEVARIYADKTLMMVSAKLHAKELME